MLALRTIVQPQPMRENATNVSGIHAGILSSFCISRSGVCYRHNSMYQTTVLSMTGECSQAVITGQ